MRAFWTPMILAGWSAGSRHPRNRSCWRVTSNCGPAWQPRKSHDVVATTGRRRGPSGRAIIEAARKVSGGALDAGDDLAVLGLAIAVSGGLFHLSVWPGNRPRASRLLG